MKRLLFISSLVLAGAFTCTSCSSCAPQGGSKPQMKSMSQDKPQDQNGSGQGCGKPCAPCDSCPAPASPCDNAAVAPKAAPAEAVAPKAPALNAQAEKKVEKQKPVLSEAPQKENLPIVKEDRAMNDSKTSHAEANKSEDAISLVKKDAPEAAAKLEQTSGN